MTPKNVFHRPLIVRRRYTDRDYLDYLQKSFVIERRKDARGRDPYYELVMYPLLRDNEYRLQFDDGSKYKPDYDYLKRDLKLHTEFLRDPNLETKSWIELFRFVDAFMQLRVNGFNSAFEKKAEIDTIGMMLGDFFRDKKFVSDRGGLAIAAQKATSIYIYDDVDTHRSSKKKKRALVLQPGENIDYLRAIDFAFSEEVDVYDWSENSADYMSGFCVPGDGISTIVMRSSIFRGQHFGLLYTPGHLIGQSGGVLDEIIFDVFTSNLNQQGSKSSGTTNNDPNVMKALDIHYGPRLQKTLKRASKKDASRIELHLRNFNHDVL